MANFFDYEQTQGIKKNNKNFFDYDEQKAELETQPTSFFDYNEQNELKNNTSNSFFDYKEQPTKLKRSKPNKSKIKYLPNGEVDTEHYKAHIDEIADIPQVDMPVMGNIVDSNGKVLSGGVSKDVRYYNERFPDRKNRFSYDIEEFKNKNNKNIGDIAKLTGSALWNIPTGFVSNIAKDTGDTVKGLAQMLGAGINKTIFTPVMRMAKGQAPVTDENIENAKKFGKSYVNSITSLPKLFQRDEQGRNKYRVQYRQDHPEVAAMKDALVQGLKENYGQKDIDIISENGINFDPVGFAQSYYAHPLNLLDVVGLGEVGKLKPIAQLTKGGQASNLAKTLGNKTIRPKYSENLVINAGQRVLESEPVQNIVNMVDESSLRPITDITADFLGLNPDSRLLGSKGANIRQTKLLEQANQTNNITQRNEAFKNNAELFSGLEDAEAKNLIKSIESGQGQAYIERLKNLIKPDIYLDDAAAKEYQNLIKQDLDNMKADKFKLQTAHNSSRKGIFTQVIDNGLDMDLRRADESYNSLINKIKRNPALLDNENYIDSLYNELGKNLNFPDDALNEQYYTNLTKAIDKGFEYNDITRNLEQSKTFDYRAEKELNNLQPLSERAKEVKQALRNKVQENADFYVERGLLEQNTVNELPINNYASIKYNKPIESLSDAEKVEAFKDFNKLSEEQRPFYIPMMFEDNLKASDFFANTTKRYKPNELRQRKAGMGLEVNKRGSQRVYDPVELMNRLDAHRIKLVNTEKMINEVIENFAKPYKVGENLIEGYVPFNPDAFLKFYRGSINLNETTLRKIQELGNIDTAMKEAIEESIRTLPDEIVSYMGAMKNNNIYQIPKEVAETLSFGKGKKGILEQAFDMGTAGFKRKVLGLSPKWFINNRIGNGIMAGLKGVGIDDYIKALRIDDKQFPKELLSDSLYEAEKTIIGRTGGGDNNTFSNLSRFLGGEFIDTSTLKGIDKTKMQLANSLAIPGKVINSITDKMFAFNQYFEKLERKATYLSNVDKIGRKMMKTTGQNIVKQDELMKYIENNEPLKAEVLKNVNETLGDYISMTPVERRVLRKAIPFYSWFRTITRYTLSLAETNPIRADLVNKIATVFYEENTNLPEYQQGATKTEFNSNITGKPLLINYEHSIPFSTFGDTADNPVSLFNPLITRPIEAMTGNRFFMNRPLVSPNYENQFGGGYKDLNKMNEGEYIQELPIGERLKALPLDYIRTSVPTAEAFERVGIGTLMNLYNNKGFKPYDALFDTGIGGYNYDEGFYKNPKGWNNTEQLLRMFFPIQQEGQKKEVKRPPKRKVK